MTILLHEEHPQRLKKTAPSPRTCSPGARTGCPRAVQAPMVGIPGVVGAVRGRTWAPLTQPCPLLAGTQYKGDIAASLQLQLPAGFMGKTYSF